MGRFVSLMKIDDEIVINGEVKISLRETSRGRAVLAIEAPREYGIELDKASEREDFDDSET